MENRFDLKKMLAEIKQDEAARPRATQVVSQDEIRERVMRRRKAAKHAQQ